MNTLYADVQTYIGPGGLPTGIRSTDGGRSWIEIGGGFPRGVVREFLFDPLQAGVIYVASVPVVFPYVASDTGVFKSVDNGATWTSFTTVLSNVFVYSLAIDEGPTRTLYAGTEAGLFKSTDGAASFVATGFTNPVGWVVVNPRNSRNLFVTSRAMGVFESFDGGQSWASISAGLLDLSFQALVIDSAGTSLHVATRIGVFDCLLRSSPRVVPLR